MKATITYQALAALLAVAMAAGPVQSQWVTTPGTTVSVTENTLVSINARVIHSGTLANAGYLALYSDWTNQGTYRGTGTLALKGVNQVLDHRGGEITTLEVSGGGIKSVLSNATVQHSLAFTEGRLSVAKGSSLYIAKNGSISGASQAGYVQGRLALSGTGTLHYPIGTASVYAPVTLLGVEGSHASIGFEVLELLTAPESGSSGLLDFSKNRYWERTVESGTVTKAQITLPMINETFLLSTHEASVAASESPSGGYVSLGQQKVTGTAVSGTVTGYEQALFRYYLVGRELIGNRTADSLALVDTYQKGGGREWVHQGNWLTGPLDTWTGVSLQSNRVVDLRLPSNNMEGTLSGELRKLTAARVIDLSSNKLRGAIPERLSGLQVLQTLNLSNNKLEDMGDMSAMVGIQSVDVSGNHLHFDDLEPNLGLSNFLYADQALLGSKTDTLLPVHSSYLQSFEVGGSANSYKWLYNGQVVEDATSASYLIADLNLNIMGTYQLEVVSSLVPGLVLGSHPRRLVPTAIISGTITNQAGVPLPHATGAGLLIRKGSYDSTQMYTADASGNFVLENVELSDYLLYGSQNVDLYIPTYYRGSIDWVFADTLRLRENKTGLLIALANKPKERTPAAGDNSVEGSLESELEDTEGGRLLARNRVRGAGVTLSRQVIRGRGLEEAEYELVAYVETNDSGEFEMDNLSDGRYRLNVQYPGIPMDPKSFVEFDLGGGDKVEKNNLKVSAVVTPGGIVVKKTGETGTASAYFKGLEVYPNPADKYLSIRYEKLVKGKVVAELLDINGNKLMAVDMERGKNQHVDLRMEGIRNGLYILRFYDMEGGNRHIADVRVLVKR